MTPEVQIAAIVAIPTLVSLYLTDRRARKRAERQESREEDTLLRDKEAQRRANEIADDSDVQLRHITVLTNSTLTAANKHIEELEAHETELLAHINDLEKQVATLLEEVRRLRA